MTAIQHPLANLIEDGDGESQSNIDGKDYVGCRIFAYSRSGDSTTSRSEDDGRFAFRT